MLNEFEDQDYVEAPNDKENIVNTPPRSWDELAAQQRANRETEQMNANQRLFDGFVNIETAARDRQLALNHQRAIAGAAMIDSAFRNGGMSDRSLSQAFSEAFGQPIYGGQLLDLPDGQGKAFVMYGAAKDPQTGEAKVAPVAMMDGTQMMKVLQSANLGERTEGVQKAIYGDLSSRFTPDQLGKMGVSRPSAPISTGGAVISAAGMRALRGEPRPRSTISVFSNIGDGGYAGTGTRSATIRPDGTREEVTTGSRDPNYQGKWKVLESNADGQRYANDKTGEEVFVPKGDNLRNVLQRGGSERERIAQMNNESREKRAQIAADAKRGSGGQGGASPSFDKTKAEAMSAWLKANGKKITVKDATGVETMVDNPDYDDESYKRRKKQYDEYLWGADEAVPTTTSGQPAREEVLAEIQRRKAAKSSTGGAASQEPKAKPTTQPQPTPTQKPKRDETAEVPTTGKQQGDSHQNASLSERRDKEYEDGMKEIRATAEKRKKELGWGGLEKWSDRDAEAYIRREEFLLKERLRKKYNAIQSAMK